MRWLFLSLAIVLAAIEAYGAQQIQMPEAGAFVADEDLVAQITDMKHNITELWENFRALKTILTETLNHLRVHQSELEETVHMLEHKHDDGGSFHGSYTDDHHHHSGEQHSHGGDSHGDEHHHHSGEHHSHSGEQHSHGDDHSHGGHSHSGEHHSHSGHESDDHHHHDSHEKSDDLQQVSQTADRIEPLVMPTQTQQHYHHHQQQPQISMPKTLQLINDSYFNSHHHHHHHHRNQARSQRNRTVVIPKYSEIGEYDFAVCNVQPNRAIPVDDQQDIMGRINLWQKKTGGPLNIHVRVQGFDMGGHHGHHGDHQSVQQEQEETSEAAAPIVHKHGFHIHTLGDLSNGCQSTGPHFNPKGVNHGGPTALVRHVGDLGNIECDNHGNANIVFNDEIASLQGPYSIIGKSMVIHAKQDDYGLGGDEESLKTGNAGTRIACCIIEKIDKLPMRAYKNIKTASQYIN